MLIERSEPLDVLNGALRLAASGRGNVIIVGGEAGIGKTSLLREFAIEARSRAEVHWGGCEALFTPRPLGPLQDMAQAVDARVAELLEETASQERIFTALLNALQDARRTRVLIFEDVHWADKATLDLIKYLGRRVGTMKTVLVLSMRSDEIGASHPLAQVLGDIPSGQTTRIALKPLSAQGVDILARQAGRKDDRLFDITEGNPFFVTELLASNPSGGEEIPASVRDAVWSRIGRLEDRERELLEKISIVPGSIEPWLLHAMMGETADGAVDSCVARGLLQRDGQGQLKFRHELARKATLERLLLSVQKALHGRVEEILSQQAPTQLSRRVHHAAGADDCERVLALAPLAAAQSAGLGSHLEAASHLSTALKYVRDATPELAATLYESWAYEAGLALKIDDSIIAARHKAIALWRELGRVDKVGLNLRWLSRLHWYRGEAHDAENYVSQAVRELEGIKPGPELAMAYSALSQMHMLHDRTDEALDWGRRAIALAEELGEEETRAHALNNVASALMFSGRGGGEPYMEESLAIALKHGFHEQAARAYTNYSGYAIVTKNFALAERLLSEGIAFDSKHDLDSWTYYLVGRQAQLRMDQGRLREAQSIARGVLAMEHQTLVMKLPSLSVLSTVHARLGEDDADELLQRSLKDALATGEPQHIMPVRISRAEAAWLAGDLDACRVELKELVQLGLDKFDPWELGELAVWWIRSEMTDPFPGADGKIASPYAAEIRGDGEAAASEWLALGLPYEAALALMSVDALAGAVQIFDEIEAKPAAAIVRRRAKALGMELALPKHRRGPYAAAKAHPLGLTQREIEVLELLAEGLGNSDIARKLVRSQRTVEHHVSSVLAKLNATSRMDVVLRLRNEPWLLPDKK
jgi:DNA-binding CsgD family transcriptional regulator/tetratricopeptide (TPR) repeat protein